MIQVTDNLHQAILNKSRLDKFILVLNLPPALKDIVSNTVRAKELVNLNSIQFSIYGSPVPSLSVPAVDMPFAGQTTKVSSAVRPAYPPLTVSFTVDNLFTNWWVLWKWLDLINGAKTSAYHPPAGADHNPKNAIGTLADYSTDVTVYGLTEFNQRVIEFDYTGCFITDLSEVTFNYRNTDETEASFVLNYSQFNAELLDFGSTPSIN